MRPIQTTIAMIALAAAVALIHPGLIGPAMAQTGAIRIPVLVPLTGPLALEGTSQRNGAVMALTDAPVGVRIEYEVLDTGAAPETAVNALERVLARGGVSVIVAPIFGAQMLAMLPIAAERKVPLITISGTAQLTEMGNPYVFRFFPNDSVAKTAHALYVVEALGKKRPAVLFQTTAYGQSGRQHLAANFARLGATVVFEEGLDINLKDFLPALIKAKQANADALVLQLHAAPTALLLRQAASMGLGIPIVAGSAMHQPTTAALLQPAERKGVCAESASSPVSSIDPAVERWVAAYRREFGAEPDDFALTQYDAVRMAIDAAVQGARGPEEMRAALASGNFTGLAMTYKSDGMGNMAHDAIIMCYDDQGRPRIDRRYPRLG